MIVDYMSFLEALAQRVIPIIHPLITYTHIQKGVSIHTFDPTFLPKLMAHGYMGVKKRNVSALIHDTDTYHKINYVE